MKREYRVEDGELVVSTSYTEDDVRVPWWAWFRLRVARLMVWL